MRKYFVSIIIIIFFCNKAPCGAFHMLNCLIKNINEMLLRKNVLIPNNGIFWILVITLSAFTSDVLVSAPLLIFKIIYGIRY